MSPVRIAVVKSVSVIGLGKLGFPLAVCLASRGFRVIGVDVDPKLIEIVKSGKVPSAEPLVAPLFRRVRKQINFTRDAEYAVQNSDATLIVVPTPSEANGHFSTRYVEEALGPVARGLRTKTRFHLVIVVSTVLP